MWSSRHSREANDVFRIVQLGRAVRGALKLPPLAAELYDPDRNWRRTGRQAPVAHYRGTGFGLNPSEASLAEQ